MKQCFSLLSGYNFVNVVIVKKPLNKYTVSNRKGLRLEILVLLGLVAG